MEFLCFGAIAVFLILIVVAYRKVGKKDTPKNNRSAPPLSQASATEPVDSAAATRTQAQGGEAADRELLAYEAREAQVREIRAREIKARSIQAREDRAREIQARALRDREARAPEAQVGAADALSVLTIQVSYGGPAVDSRSAKSSADCWIPPGREARIGNRTVPGGMIYVGSNLPAVRSHHQVEPALIDPAALREDGRPDLSGQDMNYWPSYSSISPTTRSGYLEWLERGRSDPGTGLGLVFLFFYGLERRALHDAQSDPVAREELAEIRVEVERLIGIYSGSGSFRNYASGFLAVLDHIVTQPGYDPTPRAYQNGMEVPLDIRCAAGRASKEGKPISGELAFAWATSEPSIPLRTPARRCRDEFRELFLRRYTARFGQGITVPPCKRNVRVEYRPASPSFSGTYQASTDLPDVTTLVDPKRKLTELVESATGDLEAYSRKLGRDPTPADRLAAAALLPPELLESHAPSEVRELIQRLEEVLADREIEVLPAPEVMSPWLPKDGTKQSKKDAVAAVSMLAHSGIGIEPDVRFGGAKISATDKVAIFAVHPGDPQAPSSAYAAASLLVHLATMVVVADNGVSMAEEQQLHGHVTRALNLADGERRRLSAHVALLLANAPGLAGIKKRVEALSAEQRHAIGRFLVQVAAADGHVDAAEVTTLTKLFRVLELDPGDVHGELHAIQVGGPGADVPVLVRPADPAAPGTPIPPRPGAEPKSAAPALDMSVIEAKLQESASVSALLSSIFADEEVNGTADVEEADDGRLDRAHAALLRDLSQQKVWSREEYEAVASRLNLMPDGALDVLNELAWDTCNEALAEDGDPLEINMEVCKALLAS